MPVVIRTSLLLIASNVFMTLAWYAHLRNLSGRPWYVAALAYCRQVWVERHR